MVRVCKSSSNRVVVRLSLLVAAIAVGSCAGSTPVRAPDIARSPFPEKAPAPYTLQAGDLIAVKFWGNPELDEELMIRPDGLISVPFVDEVQAAGLTPAELDAELTRRYAGELQNPQITVIVREVGGNRVFVGGEVGGARAVDLNGRMTLLQAITEAEYFLETARQKDVIVVRTMPNGERLARMIDLRPVLSGQDPSGDIVLQASDIVIVPRSKITSVNQFLRQYWYELLPVRFVTTYDLATE